MNYRKFLILLIIFLSLQMPSLYAQESINIIRNGEFDTKLLNWSVKCYNNSSATYSISDSSLLSGNNSLKIAANYAGDSLKDIKITQSLPIKIGRYYNLSFMAVANCKHKIIAAITSDKTPNNILWNTPVLEVSDKPQHFGPFTFRNQLPDSTRLLSFLSGGQNNSTLWLDSIVLNMTDDPEYKRYEEIIEEKVENKLNELITTADNEFLKLHYNSIINLVGNKINLMSYYYSPLERLLLSLDSTNSLYSINELSSYLERKRPFIISWTSQTDGRASLAWLVPPVNWNPDNVYPLYVSLHGYIPVYNNPLEYLIYYLQPDSIINNVFEDGYTLYPWGRGNIFFRGLGERDVFESISFLERFARIDPGRKYLVGASMGGAGVWSVAVNSPEVWAALGIYSGGTWDNGLLSDTAAQKLKNIPVYFICGDEDQLMQSNLTAYRLLQVAGNTDLAFETFHGGHVFYPENWKTMYNWIKTRKKENQTSIEAKNNNISTGFELYNNYPNPFNPETIISYNLPFTCKVDLKIFDLLGREIAILVDKEQKPGRYEIIFSGKNLNSGIYICKISAVSFGNAGKYILTKKLVLLK